MQFQQPTVGTFGVTQTLADERFTGDTTFIVNNVNDQVRYFCVAMNHDTNNRTGRILVQGVQTGHVYYSYNPSLTATNVLDWFPVMPELDADYLISVAGVFVPGPGALGTYHFNVIGMATAPVTQLDANSADLRPYPVRTIMSEPALQSNQNRCGVPTDLLIPAPPSGQGTLIYSLHVSYPQPGAVPTSGYFTVDGINWGWALQPHTMTQIIRPGPYLTQLAVSCHDNGGTTFAFAVGIWRYVDLAEYF